MFAVILAVSVITIVIIFCSALPYVLFPKEQTTSLTESDDIPLSHNVPVDSHMNCKNDIFIVVEHPDEQIAVGTVPR